MTQLSMCVVRNWNILSQALKIMLKGFLSGSSTMVTESVKEKLLAVTLDKNLNFKGHVNANM